MVNENRLPQSLQIQPKKLVPQLEKPNQEPVSQDLSIEQEIECICCHDVMTLPL